MSLFFLVLSVITFAISHFFARLAKPDKNFSFEKIFEFHGKQKDFVTRLEAWARQHPQYHLIKEHDQSFIIDEPATLMSYGYFYHVQLAQNDKNILLVRIYGQPKLVSTPKDPEQLVEKFHSLDLKESA